MASKKQTYSIRAEQIVRAVKGWLTIKLSDGREVKVRKSQVKMIEGGITNRRVGDRRFDCSKYQQGKSPEGNHTMDNGDKIAQQLRGLSVDEVYSKAAKVLGETIKDLKSKYGHLNTGMQRMNLGNRIRAAL